MRITISIFTLLILFMSSVTWGIPTDREIVAGQRLGKVCLGDSQAAVRKKLGKPNSSDQEDGYTLESFGTPKKGDMIGVIYKDGRVIQIETFYPAFRTREGIGRESSWPELKKAYPHLKLFSTGDKKEYPEEVRNYYVDSRGIAFMLDNSWPPVTDKDTIVFLVVVFRKGSGPVMNSGGKLRMLK